MRKYIIHRTPGTPLTFEHRTILQRDWNNRVERGRMPTLREFARDHGLPFETWRREYNRGKTGRTVPDSARPGRWTFALYDAGAAQDKVNGAKGSSLLIQLY